MADKVSNQLLQRFLDGEVTAGERAEVEARLAEDAEARARLDAGREIGGLVRAYSARALETAPLDGLLGDIEAAIARDAAGVTDLGAVRAAKQKDNGASNTREVMSARAAATPKPRSGRLIASIILGGLAAAAAAGLFYVRSQGARKKQAPTAPVATSERDAAIAAATAAADAVTNQASIESLDVAGAASTIFTIPDDTGDSTTTVIWLSPDDDQGTGG